MLHRQDTRQQNTLIAVKLVEREGTSLEQLIVFHYGIKDCIFYYSMGVCTGVTLVLCWCYAGVMSVLHLLQFADNNCLQEMRSNLTSICYAKLWRKVCNSYSWFICWSHVYNNDCWAHVAML